jgi:hypothetical protein
MLAFELLQGVHDDKDHGKRKKKGGPGPKGRGRGTGKGKGKGKGGTDPCCFRDPNTGDVFCFC